MPTSRILSDSDYICRHRGICSSRMTEKNKFSLFINALLAQCLAAFIMLMLFRISEFITLADAVIPPNISARRFLLYLVQTEALGSLLYTLLLGLPVALISLINRQIGLLTGRFFLFVLVVVYLATTQFFYTTRLLLDKVVFYFSVRELGVILQSETGDSIGVYLWFYVITLLVFYGIAKLVLRQNAFFRNRHRWIPATGFSLISLAALSLLASHGSKLPTNASNIARSKTQYFFASVVNEFLPGERRRDYKTQVDEYRAFSHLEPSRYQYQFPLIHRFDMKTGSISEYFNAFDGPPNVVMVFCEGLSASFSGPDAAYGDMTPHLDSLYTRGLYWPNALSNTDRTHGIFANALASMPHGFERGMTNLKIKPYPQHFSVPKYLITQGYDAAFLYGGWAYFDNYEPYLRKNFIEKIYGETFFKENYHARAFVHGSDHSWGIPDKPFFDLFFHLKPEDQLKSPYLAIFLNQSLHSPYKIPEQEKYSLIAKDRFMKVNGDVQLYEKYIDKWATISYIDEAIGDFMAQYRERPDYENTVFIFMGDHNFFGLPLLNDLDIHHVPLVIFSEKLKAPHTFKDVVAQTDLPASIVKLIAPYLPKGHLPEYSNWMSSGLSTTNTLHATKPIFLGTFTGRIQGVVRGDKAYINEKFFQLKPHLDLLQIDDREAEKTYKNALDDYREINKYVIENDKLFLNPDSIYRNHRGEFYFPQ